MERKKIQCSFNPEIIYNLFLDPILKCNLYYFKFVLFKLVLATQTTQQCYP